VSDTADKTDWNPLLREEFAKPYWAALMDFVKAERSQHLVFPPHEDVFAALHLTPYADTRVVILGQDPYHGPGQAHGLCFSVQRGVKTPPSLRNMFKELEADLGLVAPDHGNLENWARQGVLLLNTTLTVRAHEAASHQRQGWEGPAPLTPVGAPRLLRFEALQPNQHRPHRRRPRPHQLATVSVSGHVPSGHVPLL